MIDAMLHVHCGDTSASSMRQSRVPGDCIVWSDLLNEGPAKATRTREAWHRQRAAFLAKMTGGALDADKVKIRLREQDQALADARLYNEVILWFDACLFDMCHLMHHLDFLAPLTKHRARLTIICLDDYPTVENFRGLGQLNPADFQTLLPYRQPVSREQFAYGQAAWKHYCSADPMALDAFRLAGGPTLPALQDALKRHLQQAPWTTNGLSRSANALLRCIADGHRQPASSFRASQELEERPFAGDSTVYYWLNQLITAATPALSTSSQSPLPVWDVDTDTQPVELSLTAFGEDLLAGSADWVATNGIDQYLGGAHQTARKHVRWNPDAERLTQSQVG